MEICASQTHTHTLTPARPPEIGPIGASENIEEKPAARLKISKGTLSSGIILLAGLAWLGLVGWCLFQSALAGVRARGREVAHVCDLSSPQNYQHAGNSGTSSSTIKLCIQEGRCRFFLFASYKTAAIWHASERASETHNNNNACVRVRCACVYLCTTIERREKN